MDKYSVALDALNEWAIYARENPHGQNFEQWLICKITYQKNEPLIEAKDSNVKHGELLIHLNDKGIVVQNVNHKSLMVLPLDPDAVKVQTSDELNRFI